jgi:cytochrome c peroxidase
MKKRHYIFLFCVSLLIYTCTKEQSKPEAYVATPYALTVPSGFPQPIIPSENPLTVEGIKLGRMLYYDPILSTNGLTCNSCHIQSKSYSSPLFTSQTGEKISVPPHVNLAWNNNYNWNGSEPILDRLCLGDFGPAFFNTNMTLLVQKLKAHSSYPTLFKQAFNIDDVENLSHSEIQLKIVYSISQFMRTMTSSNSKFDKMIRHETMLSPQEYDGFETFYTERGDCFHCHGYPLLTSNNFKNNGLDSSYSTINFGRYNVSHDSSDIGKFSTPTLRNIELTAPYMHDGRFATLEEVVEFYNSGVHWNSPNIDALMTKPAKQYGLNLTATQKTNLVLFLKTFTDTSYINNPNYQSPH